jgi:hypothetical protein
MTKDVVEWESRMGQRTRRYGPLAAAVAAAAALSAPAIASAAPAIQITDAGPAIAGLSSADEVASQLLGPGVTLAGPATIDGTAAAGSYASALPSSGASPTATPTSASPTA